MGQATKLKAKANKQNMSSLGEAGLIRLVAQAFGTAARGRRPAPGASLGIGDDCAVIPVARDRSLLVTTDLLVERVHFLRDRMPAADLGHKALAVNLSDIAAMGGRPQSVFLSWALPREVPVAWVREFLRGMRALARRAGVQVLGGDTTASKSDLFLNLLVVGEARPPQVKLRSSARPGDLICVTGELGDSKAGLEVLLAGESRKATPNRDALERTLLARHFRPRPHLEEGAFLGRAPAVHAMMDVSDGLDSDLRKILSASGVGAEVSLEALPLSAELEAYATRRHRDPALYAAAGGEDYVLLFTVDPRALTALARRYRAAFGQDFHVVGRVTKGPARLRYFAGGRAVRPRLAGFEHF